MNIYRINALVVALAVLVFCSSCGSGSQPSSVPSQSSSSGTLFSSGPGDAVKEYFNAANRNDYNALYQFYCEGIIDVNARNGNSLREAIPRIANGISRNGQISRVEITDENTQGTTGNVKFRVTWNDGLTSAEHTMKLISENGAWKVMEVFGAQTLNNDIASGDFTGERRLAAAAAEEAARPAREAREAAQREAQMNAAAAEEAARPAREAAQRLAQSDAQRKDRIQILRHSLQENMEMANDQRRRAAELEMKAQNTPSPYDGDLRRERDKALAKADAAEWAAKRTEERIAALVNARTPEEIAAALENANRDY